MAPSSPTHPDRAVRMTDGALVLLMLGATFALGCQELYDSDIWWHVRSGQWIWEHRQIPRLDPFTFTSSDRLWIDLHWVFQVLLATAFGAGGARGMIVMAAGMCTAVLLVALTARDRRGPTWVAVACWLPALVVMSAIRPAPRIVLAPGHGGLPSRPGTNRLRSGAGLDPAVRPGDLGQRAWPLRAGPDHPRRLHGRPPRRQEGSGRKPAVVGACRWRRRGGRVRVPGEPLRPARGDVSP